MSEPEEVKKTEKEKIEERREEVLANGRKFKYPLQYSKHKLVIITVIVAVVALIGAGTLGWFMLYQMQDTSDVMYRLTKILPVSVAKVDGKRVRYADYLMIYKSSVQPIEQQSGALGDDEEAVERKNYYKRAALDEAEEYALATKLAQELEVSVTDEEVTKSFDDHRKVGGTELSVESFLRILKDNFGMDEEEYRRMLKLSLLKQKVSVKIDSVAKNTTEEVVAFLKENDGDFGKAREQFGGRVQYEDTGGLVSVQNVDGGRATEAYKLEKGQVSAFVSTNGDGYYVVKLLDKNETEVSYVSLFVEFTEFGKRMSQMRDEGKVEEWIEF